METVTDAVLWESDEFFAPVKSDFIDGLVGQYNDEKQRIINMAAAVRGKECEGVMHYFIDGCDRDDKYALPRAVGDLFNVDNAIAYLNAAYWQKALQHTDVFDYMPQKRRDEWNAQIRSPLGKKGRKYSNEDAIPPLPAFEDATVRATLADLLASRAKFFAERVDGIFKALSRAHVTNEPQGFSKRMILGYVITYGSPDYSKCGYINDLRSVIAKFMGRDEPGHGATEPVVRAAMRNPGKWMSVDGGALRIRVYTGIGTAHLEVHPDMAWRLNAVLASLYPSAIPAEFRRKPVRSKKEKQVEVFNRPLPFAVINILARMERARTWTKDENARDGGYFTNVPNALEFSYSVQTGSKHAIEAASDVLKSIGGVWVPTKGRGYFQFDYDPVEVLDEIVCSGCIPDHKSHQFYPTPEKLAKLVVEMATEGAEPGMHWLEPSAGTGGIADHVPKDASLTCYEISPLHCKVLEAKGFQRTGSRIVKCLNFLELASDYRGGGYHRVVMNPPFSEGRWQAHVAAAGKTVRKGGVLVAILPASARNKDILPGFQCEWSQVYENEFAGTSVSVAILKATK